LLSGCAFATTFFINSKIVLQVLLDETHRHCEALLSYCKSAKAVAISYAHINLSEWDRHSPC